MESICAVNKVRLKSKIYNIFIYNIFFCIKLTTKVHPKLVMWPKMVNFVP